MTVYRLVEPCAEYMDSYMEAYEEYAAAGVYGYGFTDARQTDVLKKFEDYRCERNLKPNRVGAHFYWLVDDKKRKFIGEITIRHRLNDALKRYGGHIGYGVRLTEQNKGMGTRMLQLALEEAQKLGLEEVLITCDDDNIASARVMEKNGFQLLDKVENVMDGKRVWTRRYVKVLRDKMS